MGVTLEQKKVVKSEINFGLVFFTVPGHGYKFQMTC